MSWNHVCKMSRKNQIALIYKIHCNSNKSLRQKCDFQLVGCGSVRNVSTVTFFPPIPGVMRILVSAEGHRIISQMRNRDETNDKTNVNHPPREKTLIVMRKESRLSSCYWTCLALLLVSHSTLAGLAPRSLMREQEQHRGMLSQSLDSLLERQDVLEDTVDFLDNLEADFLIATSSPTRVLLEDVQVY